MCDGWVVRVAYTPFRSFISGEAERDKRKLSVSIGKVESKNASNPSNTVYLHFVRGSCCKYRGEFPASGQKHKHEQNLRFHNFLNCHNRSHLARTNTVEAISPSFWCWFDRQELKLQQTPSMIHNLMQIRNNDRINFGFNLVLSH